MRSLRIAAVTALLAVATLAVPGSPATAERPAERAQYQRTVFFDMFYTENVKPSRLFLTANSGPYFKKLRWKNWGANRTVARGRFISDCASCGPKENKAARVTMRKLIPCKRQKVMTYRFTTFKVFDRKRPNRVLKWKNECPPPGFDQD